jgi:hypothetical protein
VLLLAGGKGEAMILALVLNVLEGVIFTVGAVLALRQRYTVHRWVQTGGVILSVILAVKTMALPNLFTLRNPAPPALRWVTVVHGTVGAIAVLFGIYVALVGNHVMIRRLSFTKYKPYMRTAYLLYMTAILLGIVVYIISRPPR